MQDGSDAEEEAEVDDEEMDEDKDDDADEDSIDDLLGSDHENEDHEYIVSKVQAAKAKPSVPVKSGKPSKTSKAIPAMKSKRAVAVEKHTTHSSSKKARNEGSHSSTLPKKKPRTA